MEMERQRKQPPEDEKSLKNVEEVENQTATFVNPKIPGKCKIYGGSDAENVTVNRGSERTIPDTILGRYHNLSHKDDSKQKKTQNASISNIIIIAYTILFLVLGFFVYRDISKRLSILGNRMSKIEDAISAKITPSIENIEIYDAE